MKLENPKEIYDLFVFVNSVKPVSLFVKVKSNTTLKLFG